LGVADVVNIDLSEGFEHLSRAPIAEALLDIRARAETEWNDAAMLDELRRSLPDYPNATVRKQFATELHMAADCPPHANHRDLGQILMLKSQDGYHVAQFSRDGFTFSRLRPYVDWEHFRDEALRVWIIFSALGQPTELQRIGLRFINRMDLPPDGFELKQALIHDPKPPQGFTVPFLGFMQFDTLSVPGHPYAVNLIRTIQPPQLPAQPAAGLIVDVDVFTLQPAEFRPQLLVKRLNEMRWLKNKAFFGTVTPDFINKFK
jgi:uncharacterized protein (TIGR04255 family)